MRCELTTVRWLPPPWSTSPLSIKDADTLATSAPSLDQLRRSPPAESHSNARSCHSNSVERVERRQALSEDPETLMFLPGAAGDTEFWRPVSEGLSHPGARVFFGWPGFGGTPPDPKVSGISELARGSLSSSPVPPSWSSKAESTISPADTRGRFCLTSSGTWRSERLVRCPNR